MERTKYQIIRSLMGEGKSLWELIKDQDSHLLMFTQAIKYLMNNGYLDYNSNNGFFRLVNIPYEFKDVEGEDYYCPECNGNGIAIKGRFKDALEKFQDATKDRPIPSPKYDQGIILPHYLAIKGIFMDLRGDLFNNRVILLGDDDLFSLFIAFLRCCKRILTIDVDDRILVYIDKKAKEYSLQIETLKHDLSKPLPKDLFQEFDIFISEPPEAFRGIRLFLENGILALKSPGGVGYFGLTTLESSKEKWYRIQKLLLDNNMVTTDIIKNFSLYSYEQDRNPEFFKNYKLFNELPLNVDLPNIPWYTSCLIRVEKVDALLYNEDDLYMDEETLVTPQPFTG